MTQNCLFVCTQVAEGAILSSFVSVLGVGVTEVSMDDFSRFNLDPCVQCVIN